MDTKDLTDALREATDGLEPRTGFTADVVRGGRRRRTRGRILIGATMAVTLAVAAAVAVGVPSRLAEPADPPPKQLDGHPLFTEGGDLIHDATFVDEATRTWRKSLPNTLANKDSLLSQPLDQPHVTWAGSTPVGPAAIVAQQFTPPNATSPGDQRIAVGLVADDPATDHLELIGVQTQGHWARPGSFVFPDDRTVIAVAYASPPDSRALNISPNLTVGADGVSRREWTKPLRYDDGVWIGELPANVDPLNVRMIDSRPDLDPNDAEERPMGLHHPLLFTSQYLSGELAKVPDRGPQWAPDEVLLGTSTNLDGWDRFRAAVRDSGLLEPTSYTDIGRHWTAVVGMNDGRIALISTYQELDNPAYVFLVVLKADKTPLQVTRIAEVNLAEPVRVAVPLPDDNGWVVAVDPGEQFRYQVTGSNEWSAPVTGVALLPHNALAVKPAASEERILLK